MYREGNTRPTCDECFAKGVNVDFHVMIPTKDNWTLMSIHKTSLESSTVELGEFGRMQIEKNPRSQDRRMTADQKLFNLPFILESSLMMISTKPNTTVTQDD